HNRNGNQAGGQLERSCYRLFQTRGDALFDQQAVDNDFDGVVLALVEDGGFVQRKQLAINTSANVAVLSKLLEFLAIGALAAAYDGRQDHDAIVRLAEVAAENCLNDLFARLPSDGLTALGTMRHTDRAVDHAKVIVDFCDGTDRRTRRARGGFLLDGDGRGESLDDVHFGALHLIQKLARVRRERFHVAALPLRVNGVERK